MNKLQVKVEMKLVVPFFLDSTLTIYMLIIFLLEDKSKNQRQIEI